MVLLISYDLNKHERPEAYAAVKKVIEENSTSSIKPLYSQWLIDTQDSADTWSKRIQSVADENDYWLVVIVQRPYQGWLAQSIWDWLNART